MFRRSVDSTDSSEDLNTVGELPKISPKTLVYCFTLLVLGLVLVAVVFVLLVSFNQQKSDEPIERNLLIDTPRGITTTQYSSREFRCLGSCYCESDEDGRRVLSSRVSKSIFFSFFTLSLVFAYKNADELLNRECVAQFSEVCNGKVKQDVEFCDGDEVQGDSVTMGKEGVKHTAKFEKDEEEYQCIGHCVVNGRIFRESGRPEPKRAAEKMVCDALVQEGTVVVQVPKEGKYFFQYDKTLHRQKSSSHGGSPNINVLAKAEFIKKYLKEYCRASSIFEYSYEYQRPSNGRYESKKSRVPLCVARTHMSGVSWGNISCWKIGSGSVSSID